jgi:hypothetical protein
MGFGESFNDCFVQLIVLFPPLGLIEFFEPEFQNLMIHGADPQVRGVFVWELFVAPLSVFYIGPNLGTGGSG